MPSPSVRQLPDDVDVVAVFADLERELRKVIRRQLRGTPHRAAGERIAEEIVTLVRSRWDDAPSLHLWWNQMNGVDWSSVGLNSLYARLRDLGVDVRKILFSLARTYKWLSHPLVIIDDTGAQKYGVWMQGVSSVHIANVSSSVLGHNIVTTMLAGNEGALFVDHRVKVNPKRPRLARHPGRPLQAVRDSRATKKWEMALEMIRHARAQGLDQAWVLFDCWYLNGEVASRLGSAHATFISKAKSNTVFVIDGKEMTAKEFLESCRSYKRVRQTDHFFYQKKAKLKNGVEVKLVATWFFREKSLKVSMAVLVTSGLDVPGAEVVLTYLRRWATERGYQDWKRSLGGMAYHSTDFGHIQNYVWIGFLAYALARRARQLIAPHLGLPTILAARRKALQTMIPTRFPALRPVETMAQCAS